MTNHSLTVALAHDSIQELAPYPAGKPLEEFKREYGISDVVKLASNENSLGCSETVSQAITAQFSQLFRYPDANAHDLKQALSAFHSLPADYFTLGNGSEEVINLIGRCFISTDDAVVFGQYSFIAYPMVTASQGATAIEVPAKDYGIDLDAMQQACHDNANTKVVFIANPNNPTGTKLSKEKILSFLEAVPAHILVVLDEAYVDFEPSCDNHKLVTEHSNLIILRTFSKAYGLAAVRVGYGICNPAINDIFNRVRQPFNVNRLAQAAAIAALADRKFLAHVKNSNETQKNWLYEQFTRLGLVYVSSYTNFILVNVPNALAVNEKLLRQGVIIRPMNEYGLDEWIRVSIGTEQENKRFIEVLETLIN